jgi:hypothetical protein
MKVSELPEQLREKLQIELRRFNQATEALEKACPEFQECKTTERCKRSGICLTTLKQANLASIPYYYTLDKIERDYEEIPEAYAQRFIRDVDDCLFTINHLNNRNNSEVQTLAQQIAGRRKNIIDYLRRQEKPDYKK